MFYAHARAAFPREGQLRLLYATSDARILNFQATTMRMSLVMWVLARCEGDNILWSPVQADIIIRYFDKYWHFNPRVRVAFIDMAFMHLKLDLECEDVATTSPHEGSHMHFDSLLMRGLQNKVGSCARIRQFALVLHARTDCASAECSECCEEGGRHRPRWISHPQLLR